MSLLNKIVPTKKVSYKTLHSTQEVKRRLQDKTVSQPPKIPLIGFTPLTYHGKFEEDYFEFGRNSRGNKDHPPVACGTIKENDANPLETIVEATIRPHHNFTTGIVLFLILIVFACLPAMFSIFYGYYDSIGFFVFLPIFFSLVFLANYLVFVNYNNKLAKDIQDFIDGKILK